MNIWQEMKRQRLERLKDLTKSVDAKPLLKMALDLKSRSKEEQDAFIEMVHQSYKKSGHTFIERALMEGDITLNEWKGMQKKYGFTEEDMSCVFHAYFEKKERKNDNERMVIVSMPCSNIYKNRKFIQKRFGVFVKIPEEVLKEMAKADPEIKKEIEKLEKQGEIDAKNKTG
jgi:hypothetical protein